LNLLYLLGSIADMSAAKGELDALPYKMDECQVKERPAASTTPPPNQPTNPSSTVPCQDAAALLWRVQIILELSHMKDGPMMDELRAQVKKDRKLHLQCLNLPPDDLAFLERYG